MNSAKIPMDTKLNQNPSEKNPKTKALHAESESNNDSDQTLFPSYRLNSTTTVLLGEWLWH